MSRAKTTLDLKNLFEQKPQPLIQVNQEKSLVRKATEKEIQLSWQQYTEGKKEFAAEYIMLNRVKTIQGSNITLNLANTVEAQLLHNLKTELLTWLRDQCQDPEITVEHFIEQTDSERPAYTGKEKLDKLIEKYPVVREFKDRFSLDPEF